MPSQSHGNRDLCCVKLRSTLFVSSLHRYITPYSPTMGSLSGISPLIPTRFLTICAHLVMTIMIFWAREDNVRACLPLEYTQEIYNTKDTQLIIALSISLGLFVIELCGFFSGVSMFSHTQNIISLVFHTSGAVASVYFVFINFPCQWINNVVIACNGFPTLCELALVLKRFCLTRI